MSHPPVPILMYHRVAPPNRRSTVPGHYVHPSAFRRQMRVLKRLGYQSVPISGLACPGDLPRKPIAFSFDDGYRNFLSEAVPAMRDHGFVGAVYVVANQIGGTNAWDTREGDVEEPLMSLEELREAIRLGMEVGSHTLDHADLTAVDEPEAWRQISESKRLIEDRLQANVSSFCYPYGRKNARVRELVAQAGYLTACSIEKGMNWQSTDRLALRRINIRQDTALPVFLYKLLRGRRDER